MASLQCEIELGLLSQAERARRDWFPEWFTYTMSDAEKRAWSEHLERNSLRWTEEHCFNDDDHTPVASETTPTRSRGARTATTAEEQYGSAETDEVVQAGGERGVETSVAGSPSQQPSSPPTSSSRYPSEGPVPGLLPNHGKRQPLAIKTDLAEQPGTQASISLTLASEASGQGRDGPSSRSNVPKTQVIEHKPCVICSTPGKLCDGCGSIAYCGRNHRKQDWKRHRSACKGKAKVL